MFHLQIHKLYILYIHIYTYMHSISNFDPAESVCRYVQRSLSFRGSFWSQWDESEVTLTIIFLPLFFFISYNHASSNTVYINFSFFFFFCYYIFILFTHWTRLNPAGDTKKKSCILYRPAGLIFAQYRVKLQFAHSENKNKKK